MDILIKLLFFLFLIPSLLFAEDGSTINGSLTVENNVTADYYLGNGSLLSGISTTESDPVWTGDKVNYTVTANLNISGWDTAYSWGNHATAGYGISNLTYANIIALSNLTHYMPWNTYNGTAAYNLTIAMMTSWNGTAANNHTAVTTVNTSTANLILSGQQITALVNATQAAVWNNKGSSNLTLAEVLALSNLTNYYNKTISDSRYTNVTLAGASYLTISGQQITAGDVALTTNTSGSYVTSVATTAPVTGGAAGSEGATLTIALTQTGDIVTTAPLTINSTTNVDNIMVGGDNDFTIALTKLGDIVATAPVLINGTTAANDIVPGADQDFTISLNQLGDIVATSPVTINGTTNVDNIIPGADQDFTIAIGDVALGTKTSGNYVGSVADGTGIDGTAAAENATYTPTLDMTEVNNLTWGGNTADPLTVTFNSLGSVNPTISYGNGTITMNNRVITSSGTGFPDFIEFFVQQVKLEHLTSPTQIDAGQKRWYLLYDASTDESSDFQFIMPFTYTATQTLTLNLDFTMASATTGNCTWAAQFMATSPNDAADLETDSFATAQTDNEAIPATAGYLDQAVITFTSAQADNVVASDLVTLRIFRNATAATDTASGDAELGGIVLEWN